ncbi:MAG: choice-of-anchor D domain-containing protein, partial [bacterium]
MGTRDDGMHFRFFNTDVNHSLLVTEVILDGQAVRAGTEVGVFTRWGFCAGAGVVDNDGRVGIAAFGDDAATEIVDGFEADEPFQFRIWDSDRRVEVPAIAEFEEGPDVYSPNDISVLSLTARYELPPDIALSARLYRFGQVLVGESEEWTLRVVNLGRGDLEVTSIESDLNEFTTDFERPFTLGFLEGRNIAVTFSPSEVESYWGRLTIRSNDPEDSVLYVDLFGLGVEEVREPEITLSRSNYFFGMRRVGGDYTYTLSIGNRGGGVLLVDSIRVEGAGFSTDWQEGGRQVNPGDSYQLTLTFSPRAAQLYRGIIHIYSDDPNNGHLSFYVGGVGTERRERFNAFDSGVRHTLLITRAVIITPNEQENLLTPGDEIAVFTTWGLCAGAFAVVEEGAAIGLTAFGDNPDFPFDVGFQVNEPFAFRYWDHATRTEVEAEPEWIEGPEVFTVNGFSRLTLTGRTEVEAAQVSVEPTVQQFGPVRIGQNRSLVYRVSNIGGVNLTVQRVTSNLAVFTTNFGDQERVLGPGEGFDLTVTFTPRQTVSYEGIITIHSDDPRRPQFNFNAAGMGSDYEGHFVYYQTGISHSILIQRFLMGGGPAAVGDEIGVFTPSEMCAGAAMVEEPGEQLGLAAWGDEPETRVAVEGFRDGEEMTLRVWDASQQREYRPEIEIEEGELSFEANGFTVLSEVSVPDVFSIIPVEPIGVTETDTVSFTLRLSNPPGQMRFAFVGVEQYVQNQWRADSLQGRGEVTFRDNQNNTASFQWITNYNAAGQWRLWFRAFNDDVADQTAVLVTVRNLNRAPEIIGRFPDDRIEIQEDAAMATMAILDTVFRDPDGESLIFSFEDRRPNLIQEIRMIDNRPHYRIQPAANFSGEIRCRLIADDRMQGMPGRDVGRQIRMVVDQINEMEQVGFTGNLDSPRRDAITVYEFTVTVVEVNDPPRIRQPADSVYNVAIDEGQQLIINFSADDADHDANTLRWSMVERGNLPDEGPQFVDNQDGTARFTWTPDFTHQGQYNPLFRVVDPEGGVDQIRVNITVRDVNRPPRVRQPIPDFTVANENALLEDQDRQVLAVLNDVFEDPDGGQLAYALTENPVQLQLQIAQNSELSAQPQADFWRLDPPLRVTVRATDPGNASTTVSFLVQVIPVNDPPRVRNPIPDWTRPTGRAVPEDQQGRRQIVSLETVFDDVDD